MPQREVESAQSTFRQTVAARLSMEDSDPDPMLAPSGTGAAGADAAPRPRATRGDAEAAYGGAGTGGEAAHEAATERRTERTGSAASATGEEESGKRGEPKREPLVEDEDIFVWLATTTSVTTIVLVLLQFLWIKAHWTDVWH